MKTEVSRHSAVFVENRTAQEVRSSFEVVEAWW